MSGERYREIKTGHTKYDWITLGEVILGKPQYGSGARKVPYDGKVRYVRITDISDQGELKAGDIVSPSTVEPDRFLEPGDLLIARSGSVGRTYIHKTLSGTYQYAGYLIRFCVNPAKAIPEYVYHVTKSDSWREWIFSNSKTGTLTNINAKQYSSFQFPIPPLEVQREIVAEIEGYQKVIDGARAVVENYRPHIEIDPKWPVVALGEVISLEYGKSLKASNRIEGPYPVFGSNGIVGYHNQYLIEGPTIIVGRKGSAGAVNFSELPCYPIDTTFFVHIKDRQRLDIRFCYYQLLTLELDKVNVQSGVPGLNRNDAYRKFMVLPSLATQQAIVAEIEAEQALVDGNRELIERFEKKIRDAVGRVWEEGE